MMNNPNNKDIRKRPLVLSSWLFFALFAVLQIYILFLRPLLVQDYWDYRNDFPQPAPAREGTLEQEFISPGPLARIDILLANYRKAPVSGYLQLELFQGGKNVFQRRYPSEKAEDNQFYPFEIGPEEGLSAGHYRLRLSYLDAREEDKLAVWIFRDDIYPSGSLVINGKKQSADMTFRVYYRSTLAEHFGDILRRVPDIKGSRLIVVVAVTVFMLLMNYLVYFLIRRLFNPAQGSALSRFKISPEKENRE